MKYALSFAIRLGILATIPANISIDTPLPTPFTFICSPSHIIRAVPAVKDSTITTATNNPSVPWVYLTIDSPA